MEPEPYRRFERRAADYASGRPSYPAALVECLIDRMGLGAGAVVADVGSGTGIFTQLLIGRQLAVRAVEPGDDMRRTAEALLGGYPGFASVAGTAQATTLGNGEVDAIFCAQAFHWFNEAATRREWRRILRPGGWAALIWNNYDPDDIFTAGYLRLMRALGSGAGETMASSLATQRENALFGAAPAETLAVRNSQPLDLEGLLRRTASNSFMPPSADPRFAEVEARLRELFDRHQRDGRIAIAYHTVALLGPLE